mmetsp:Transcript_10291/g.28707  ORF Transcript_10291/g.28707 Transcript_10291/m.28707 type:complete len:220 (+) Transcript_10291:1511-2170(+)
MRKNELPSLRGPNASTRSCAGAKYFGSICTTLSQVADAGGPASLPSHGVTLTEILWVHKSTSSTTIVGPLTCRTESPGNHSTVHRSANSVSAQTTSGKPTIAKSGSRSFVTVGGSRWMGRNTGSVKPETPPLTSRNTLLRTQAAPFSVFGLTLSPALATKLAPVTRSASHDSASFTSVRLSDVYLPSVLWALSSVNPQSSPIGLTIVSAGLPEKAAISM